MADVDPRLSHATLKVLKHFLDNPTKGLSGSDISKFSKIGSGTLYPILDRLEKASWLKSNWEEIAASELGRPRRRIYHLTAHGQNKTVSALHELGVPKGGEAWAY